MRQKVAKNSAHGKNLHKRPLFTPHTASPQSGACSSLQAFAMQNLGCTRHNISKLIFCSHLHEISLVFRVLRNLICTAIQEKLYPRKSSNSPRTMAWKQAALRWIFNLVEIASARFVCKQVSPHSLTRNFQRCLSALGGELLLWWRFIGMHRGL